MSQRGDFSGFKDTMRQLPGSGIVDWAVEQISSCFRKSPKRSKFLRVKRQARKGKKLRQIIYTMSMILLIKGSVLSLDISFGDCQMSTYFDFESPFGNPNNGKFIVPKASSTVLKEKLQVQTRVFPQTPEQTTADLRNNDHPKIDGRPAKAEDKAFNDRSKRNSVPEDGQQQQQPTVEEREALETTTTAPPPAIVKQYKQLINLPDFKGSNETDQILCRIEKDLFLGLEEYALRTCAQCYSVLPKHIFWQKLNYSKESNRFYLKDELRNWRHLANYTAIVGLTFKREANVRNWLDCCGQAIKCCKAHQEFLPKTTNSSGHRIDDPKQTRFCPPTWDGYGCWGRANSGTIARTECPDHAYFLGGDAKPMCGAYIEKQCMANGSWYRNHENHEWSSYMTCHPRPHIRFRLIAGGSLHLISMAIMAPSVILLNILPSRQNNLRVFIMWMIISFLFIHNLSSGLYKIGLAVDILGTGTDIQALEAEEEITIPRQKWLELSNYLAEHSRLPDEFLKHPYFKFSDTSVPNPEANLNRYMRSANFHDQSGSKSKPCNIYEELRKLGLKRVRRNANSTAPYSDDDEVVSLVALRKKTTVRSSNFIIIMCWILMMVTHLSLSLSYAWMFAGAVYLCSVLQSAPGAPSETFIKILFYCANGIPTGFILLYIIMRSIYEPSPINVLIKAPYYWYIGADQAVIDELWENEMTCWLTGSKYDSIEIIYSIPVYIFMVGNFILLIETMWIMCTLDQPSSSRKAMSKRDYLRAAGTLVLLYGTHSALLYIMPIVESNCFLAELAYYAYSLVDGLQGVAVSYLYCYRTDECKAIVRRWMCRILGRESEDQRLISRIPSSSKRRRTNNRATNSARQNSSTRNTRVDHCHGGEMTTTVVDINIEETSMIVAQQPGWSGELTDSVSFTNQVHV